MQGITLTFAAIALLFILFLEPAKAVAAYITAIAFYPSYLTVQIGTVYITVGRIVIFVLLLKCLADTKLRNRFKWCLLDIWVLAYSFINAFVMFIGTPSMAVIQNRSGNFMDTYIVYIAVRLCVTDRAALVRLIKCISVILIPLALLGVFETCTDWHPYAMLSKYNPWRPDVNLVKEARLGFGRAVASFSHSIMFGVSLALFLPLVYLLRYEPKWQTWAYWSSGVLFLGILSSMSSGPWAMLILLIFCLAMERYKKLVKPLILLALILCFLIGIVSNRPFYHVIVTYANPLGGSSWHRAKLIDLAIEHFGEWWLLGYQGQDPGWGGSLGMSWTDVTNQFILVAVESGLIGLLTFCVFLIILFRAIAHIYNKLRDPVLKTWYWTFGSIIFATIVTWFSVSFFGQAMSLFYCVLGMIGSSIGFITNEGGNFQRIEIIPQKFKI